MSLASNVGVHDSHAHIHYVVVGQLQIHLLQTNSSFNNGVLLLDIALDPAMTGFKLSSLLVHDSADR